MALFNSRNALLVGLKSSQAVIDVTVFPTSGIKTDMLYRKDGKLYQYTNNEWEEVGSGGGGTGTVKSVNNKEPDTNGNVDLGNIASTDTRQTISGEKTFTTPPTVSGSGGKNYGLYVKGGNKWLPVAVEREVTIGGAKKKVKVELGVGSNGAGAIEVYNLTDGQTMGRVELSESGLKVAGSNVYTEATLTAGSGIKIENGVISWVRPEKITNFATAFREGYNFKGKKINITEAGYYTGANHRIMFANDYVLLINAGGGISMSYQNDQTGESGDIFRSSGDLPVEHTFVVAEGYDDNFTITGFESDIGDGVDVFAQNIFITFDELT